jgi:hypothetical protein
MVYRSASRDSASERPSIEIYHTNRVIADLAVKHTDSYLPVIKRP